MNTLMEWISLPLGYAMEWCYDLLKNYGLAILFFTLITKIILLPISVWVHKNSIKIVQIQPSLNRIKAKYFGDADAIAEHQSKLYKEKKYNPFASLIPVALQLIILIGVIGVIYHPFDYLFHMDDGLISAINALASEITGTPADSSSIQLAAVETIKNPAYYSRFMNIEGFSADLAAEIYRFDLNFLGLNLSWNPSSVLGLTVLVPVIAGLSSWVLCMVQNRANVLQSEQGKINKYGTMLFSVGLSLYLGFFVPAGIALYWVASNLLAILQLFILNAAIPPKKFVDYKELEDSRKELAALENLGGKRPRSDANAKREKADYKRFFSIANKHIVFYSEKSGFYKYYREIIEYLLQKTNLSIHYITNDPDDAIFQLAESEPRIKPYYIGVKKLITLMMRMDADMVVMTTPDLNNFYIKRSLMRKDVEYVYVPHSSAGVNMCLREHALEHFDTVFCAGPHIRDEVRGAEKFYGSKEKTLVEFGYPLIESLIDSYEHTPKTPKRRKQILIGPSWQEDNILDSCLDRLIDALYGDEYRIIVRPHPEYMKRYLPKAEALREKYKDKIGEGLVFEMDFTTNSSTYESDLLITDWSGLGAEFCFATLKPALFINTKMKVENPNYDKIGVVPQEIALRSRVGVVLEKNELDKTAETVKMLIGGDGYREKIRELRESYFYHLGSRGKFGAEYIINSLVNRKNNPEVKS